jgi:hypothetical protein
MSQTKITTNVLADGVALSNINKESSISFTKNVSTTGSISGSSISTNGTISGDSATLSGGLSADNVTASGDITADGNISGDNISYDAESDTNTVGGDLEVVGDLVGSTAKFETIESNNFLGISEFLPVFDNKPKTFSLNNTVQYGHGPLLGGRIDTGYFFNFGNPNPVPQILFVPFFIRFPKIFNTAALQVRSGNHPTEVLEGAFYGSDENGFPKNRIGDVWQWDVSQTGKVEASTPAVEVQGLIYVGLRPTIGVAGWVQNSNNGGQLEIGAISQSFSSSVILGMLFGFATTLNNFDGVVMVTNTGGATSMPEDLSNPEIRRSGFIGGGNRQPVVVLY